MSKPETKLKNKLQLLYASCHIDEEHNYHKHTYCFGHKLSSDTLETEHGTLDFSFMISDTWWTQIYN